MSSAAKLGEATQLGKVRGLDEPGAGPQETTPLERIADALAKKRAEAAACTKS